MYFSLKHRLNIGLIICFYNCNLFTRGNIFILAGDIMAELMVWLASVMIIGIGSMVIFSPVTPSTISMALIGLGRRLEARVMSWYVGR